MKRKMFILDSGYNTLTYKMVYFLRDYFEIFLISLSKKDEHSKEDYKKLGIETRFFNIVGRGYLKKKEFFKGFKEIFGFLFETIKLKIKLNKKDFVFARLGDNWVGEFLFKMFKKQKKIYFPYDIGLFYWKNPKIQRSKRDIKAEKYCFENADFILHKGPEDELNMIKESEAKIKGKPIQFLPYCFDEWMLPLKNPKTNPKKISMVFIGHFLLNNNLFRIPTDKIYKSVAKQGIALHIYAYEELKKLKGKNLYIHSPIPSKKLIKEMTNYDYLISLSFWDKKKISERFLKTTIGNRLFTPLEAGIPVVIDEEGEFASEIVKKYGCGIILSENDVPNIKKILQKQNYKKLLKNVEKAREDLRMSKQIKRLISELKI